MRSEVEYRRMMKEFYARARLMKDANVRIQNCPRCEGLNIEGETESAPGFGNIMSNIVIVGQSLCTQCMETGIPFTEGSGWLLDRILFMAGLRKWDVFTTNVVHCHPPDNRKSKESEKANCLHYLIEELGIIKPDLVITLGSDARAVFDPGAKFGVLTKCYIGYEGETVEMNWLCMYHPAYFSYGGKGIDDYIETFVETLNEFYTET